MRHALTLLPDATQGTIAYNRALKGADEHEQRDACDGDVDPVLLKAAVEEAAPHRLALRQLQEGQSIPHGGKVLKEIRGMGKVLDWRASPWTPTNGGKILPLIFVQHIPVVPNVPGIGDFVTLRNVLVAQGLMVQSATDREGNVALYTPLNYLCYQARGANQQSTGCEHMHATTGEPWTKHQMRAAAWLVQYAERRHGIPATKGSRLLSGPGVVRVDRKGQATHEAVSNKAGFHDRTDPGPGFDWAYMYSCVRYFKRHGHFAGA